MKIPVETAIKKIARYLTKTNINITDATIIATHLVEADMWGRNTHGVNVRLKSITKQLKEHSRHKPKWYIATDYGNIVNINADDELGYLMLVKAAELTVQRLEKHPLVMVGVSNTQHTGMLGYGTYLIAKAGYIAFTCCDSSPLVVPYGGTKPLLGSNPLSLAFPREPYPVLIDMATSATTMGEIKKCAQTGEKLKSGCAIDKNNIPTTDPNEALKGALLPMSDGKGTALATAVQLLSGIFTGSAPIPQNHHNYGLLFLAFKPGILRGDNDYSTQIESYIQQLQNIPLHNEKSTLRIPGERSFKCRESALKTGIDIETELWNKIQNTG
jgi:L-2-hydroxycarboxylate dehydrogenase (NAD+)